MEVQSPNPDRRIFLLSHARTGCHLLERMLSVQPNTSYGSHFFMAARSLQFPLLEQGPLSKDSERLQLSLRQAFQTGASEFEAFLCSAHKSKTRPFFHGHPHFMISPVLTSQYVHGSAGASSESDWTVRLSSSDNAAPEARTNPTVLPDRFFHSAPTVGIFTIRDPLLMVPSIYRAIAIAEIPDPSIELLRLSCTIHFSRILYDWFVGQGIPAVVVNAKDYMSVKTVKPFMKSLCTDTGMDVDAVIYEWPKLSRDELKGLPEIVVKIKSDILHSDGLRADKDVGEVVAEREEEKWRKEFGDEVAAMLKDLVERTMGDYEYMREKAIIVDNSHAIAKLVQTLC